MFLEKGVADESEGHYISPNLFLHGGSVAGGWWLDGAWRAQVWCMVGTMVLYHKQLSSMVTYLDLYVPARLSSRSTWSLI